jgi:uncharacterized protein (TIGR01370 family)
LLLTALCFAQPLNAENFAPSPFTIAFFYAANPPLSELHAFDIVVVDPDHVGISPKEYQAAHSKLFAYVSVGEADSNRRFFKKIDPAWLIADNVSWGTSVVDLANPAWRNFFLDQVVEPLWAAGYRGFFLDTLDSYQLVKDKEQIPRLADGLVAVIRGLKARHPEAQLILNRGFEVLEQVKDVTFAVAAESLYQNFDPASGTYGVVKEQDRLWLMDRLSTVRKSGLPVIAVDYVNPSERELVRATAGKIKAAGFIPWVTDKGLASLGVGSIEVQPATILGIYEHTDSATPSDPVYDHLHRYAAMPLEYLGYRIEYHDIAKPLPEGILAGRYAGVVVWPASGGSASHKGYRKWIEKVLNEKLPLVFLDGFGTEPDRSWLQMLGLQSQSGPGLAGKISIIKKDALVGFEQPFPEAAESIPLIEAVNGKVLLRVRGGKDAESDLAAIMPWGGYVLAPAVKAHELNNQTAWIVDPFRFFAEALRLPPNRPAADITSENGVRLLLTHIDGDGFESKSEWPDGRLAATELREQILKRYKLPTSLSLIAGIISPKGLYPQRSTEFESEARQLLALPHVEAASHSFSHPFNWYRVLKAENEFGYNLSIPGYSFSLQGEIRESINYLNSLLPPQKKVTMFHWTGDCVPTSEAISETYRAGVGNINGGDTIISNSRPSITAVGPMGIVKDGRLQIFAPNQNENVYTNNWNGPFYGYRRVIEAFRLTDSPRRLKPVNIYYHIYAVSKPASLKALQEVYNWSLKQQLFPVYPSSYVARVQDFFNTTVARKDDGWLIRNAGNLKQIRLPQAAGYPDLQNSRGLLGYSDFNDQRYFHLAPGGDAFLKLTGKAPNGPFLKAAAAGINTFKVTDRGIQLTATTETDGSISFDNATGCRIASDNRQLSSKSEGSVLSISIPAGSHGLELICK